MKLIGVIGLIDRMKSLFNAYVAVSYLAFAFIQNIALTEQCT